jgi:hypothetical protein
MEHTHPRFRTRSFISLLVMFSATGLALTGITLEVHGLAAPRALRHACEAVHSVFALVFTVTGIWHAVLNRRAIVAAFKPGAARLALISREAALALGLVLVLIALFIGHTLAGGADELAGRPGAGPHSGTAGPALDATLAGTRW